MRLPATPLPRILSAHEKRHGHTKVTRHMHPIPQVGNDPKARLDNNKTTKFHLLYELQITSHANIKLKEDSKYSRQDLCPI